MKIAYLIEDFAVKGGAERIVAQKACRLAADYGHDVTIVSVYRDDRPPAYPLHGVRLIYLDVPFAARERGLAGKLLSRTRVLVQAAARFNRAMDRLRPDIIFFTMSLGALMLPLYRGKARRIYESHSVKAFTPYSRFFAPMERRAEAVVCLTVGDAKEYRHARKTLVIPNFIEPAPANAVNYAVRRAIAVGRLEHAKGFDRLIRCWKKAVKGCPGWRLDIYGEGSLRDELQRQINTLGLENTVSLCGTCADMAYKYTQYSLHLMTSRYEGQGIVLIEAQAAGLPSIVFDYEYGAADIVTDGVNGFLVPQGDTRTFTERLAEMMDSEDLRAKFGTEAKETAKAFFTENIMWKWQKLIQETLNKHNR